MNADFQNPLPLPRPKVRSPLTITVTSTLMSAPVRPAQRPLVAPKPRPQSSPHLLQEQLHPPPGLRNGDLSYCDAVIEDVHETIKDEEGCEEGVHVGDEEEKKEETDKRGETSDCSEDTVKADDITEDENTEKCLTKPGGAAQTDHERISTPPDKMEDGCGGEEEELSFTASDAEEENLHQTQSLFQNENFLHDDLFNELQSRGLAFGFTLLPTVTEEYPYDVIGKTDDASDTCESSDPTETGDTEVWQPERATKDLSGCFRFTSSTEDVFGPYSVIEAFSGHVNETVDPEWCQDDTEETSSAVNEKLSPEVSHQEPYYVTSDDVEKLEDEQSLSEKAGNDQDSVRNQLRDQAEDGESVNEYADIDDSLSPKADDLSECASSEDYVEIGEEDDNSETEKKHDKRKIIKEKTAKREKTFLNQRRSCQPRLRLCNITVPIDLDLGRTPELTNRVVFAHTTEAFEEDIEELDCHIVPYYEDSDSDSEEHIYEEPVFDSEGENIPLERKTIVSRSRSYSGKVSGYVPETVPEETGSEYQTHDYCTVPLDQSREGLSHSPKTGNCGIPSVKSRRFLLYSRSAESPELSWSPSTSTSLKDELVVKRKDDSLSLPCVVSSSGSFSQRSHQSSSGISTPTSLVDIPPPFELAYITKKAVTKSSPSLLIQHEPSDTPKKKKSSFKRFLALKFKRKSDSKGFSDGSVRSSRSSSESSHHGAVRAIELDRRSTGSSPPLQSLTVKAQKSPLELSSTFVFSKDLHKRKGDANYCSKSISRVESFVERSRHSVLPLPMTKPRSISFPSADTSDYENIPALSSDYENIQVPGRPTRSHTVTEFFENPNRSAAPCNENDGYVDMNSFSGIDGKTQPSILDTESAYTEPLPLMRHCDGPPVDEDHGRTSEEEEGAAEQSFDRQIDGRSRAFFIAKDLVDSEKTHVKTLKHIQEDFRCAVLMAVDDEGDPVLEEQRLEEILGKLPQAVSFHRSLLEELEERVRQWTERPKVLDVFLSRRDEFGLFESFIAEFDRSVFLLEESCRVNPAFARIVRKFEMAASEESDVPLKHQLMQVVVRVLQYRMLFTDYLNNLSPDCQEYEDTQAALLIVSALADQANDNLKHGENLLRLVHIEYSLKGKRDLLKPGRMFVKEGTLMKVSRKSRQPRHLFLMNDIVLYTFPQQDGKYRLKNTLPLSGMKVSKPVLDDVLNSLRIEVSDITITLSASSAGEREDWFHTLSRALADHAAGLSTFRPSLEASERLWMAVGEAAPVMVPVSHVMMCMNCTCDFSLTLRRHHCNACGKVVCRSCSRNKFPLKFLKDRMAKVCDQCYVQLRNKGGGLPLTGGNTSPRPHGSGRPLSSVLQSLQTPNLWRTRKSSASLSQVCLSGEGSSISGGLQRRKKSNRKWKRLWFLLKDQVLYTFSGCEDKAPAESLPLRGFSVHPLNGDDSSNVFHLYHNKTLYYSFKAEDPPTARRWVNALEEATVL